jgi:hypothetical protein
LNFWKNLKDNLLAFLMVEFLWVHGGFIVIIANYAVSNMVGSLLLLLEDYVGVRVNSVVFCVYITIPM